MIELHQLLSDDLSYLRIKLVAETAEARTKLHRKQAALEKKMERQAAQQSIVCVLERDLRQAQTILAHLRASNATNTIVEAQQAQVDSQQVELEAHTFKPGYLSEVDAYLKQLEIDELEAVQQLRATTIAAIDALLEP